MEDLRAAAVLKKKLERLEKSIAEIEQIIAIKKNYLSLLREFDNRATIEQECQKIYIHINDYASQLFKMRVTLNSLRQGKA